MKVFSAKIRDGTIVTDAAVDLPDGATVTIVADDDDGVDVTPEQELMVDTVDVFTSGDGEEPASSALDAPLPLLVGRCRFDSGPGPGG
jgi:hypothetical protein